MVSIELWLAAGVALVVGIAIGLVLRQQRKAAQARAARAAEALRLAQAEQARLRAETEAARLRAEAEAARKREAAEAARQQAEAEAARQRAEAEALAQRAAEAARAQAAAAAALRAAEAERAEQARRAAAEQAAQARAAAQREAERQAAERQAAERAAQAARAARRPEDTLVMVADDSRTVRVKTGRLLGAQGYQVSYANDGLDALRLLQESLPDILITDVEMPGMDGFELTRHLRHDARTAQLPIIMITSADERHREEARSAGVSVLLGKPFDDAELVAHVRKLMSGLAAPAGVPA